MVENSPRPRVALRARLMDEAALEIVRIFLSARFARTRQPRGDKIKHMDQERISR